MQIINSITIAIFRLIPKNVISRMVGCFALLRLPGPILNLTINWYSNKYGVNTDEILYPEKGFKTFDDFFTRKLKNKVHSIEKSEDLVVSPVDGRIDQFGEVSHYTAIQAKGSEYQLNDFIPSSTFKNFVDASFITIYLSPADYHRIHSPVSGKIAGFYHIPGTLFTVRKFMTEKIDGLYCKNERVISYIKSNCGLVAVCKIGAMNVGKISLSYNKLITNKVFRRREEFFYSEGEHPSINKGDELGIFHLGSTVILFFQKDRIKFDKIAVGQHVRVGEKIATVQQ